jgi:hypothetical protein
MQHATPIIDWQVLPLVVVRSSPSNLELGMRRQQVG